jgi:tetratricopeptide (TPR) repeat protein
MRRPILVRVAFVVTIGAAALPSASAADAQALSALEARVRQEPENLFLAARYRQEVIGAGAYDRAITLFERLSKRSGAGAHAFINLALAYVDKVPASGSVRQAFLGRDAIHALTQSIAIQPSELAYFVRGLVNLYYDNALFHRTDKGVADLEEARRLASVRGLQGYLPRILQTLGDGYFRLARPDKARDAWRSALALAPDSEPLQHRLAATDAQLREIIAHVLDADVRVDTSLRELNPADVASGPTR